MTEKNKQGFTIVELLIVMVVIAILAGIVTTMIIGARNKAYEAVAKHDLSQLSKLKEVFYAENGWLPGSNNDGSWSIQLILNDFKKAGTFKFSGIDNYGSMNSAGPHRGFMMYYLNNGNGSTTLGSYGDVLYICMAVMPRSGVPMYYSTDAGVFTPDPPGDKSNNYNFLANCTTDKYGTWRIYGTFKLEDYVD